MKTERTEKENSLYSEKSVLNIIKMVQNKSKIWCLVFLRDTSSY